MGKDEGQHVERDRAKYTLNELMRGVFLGSGGDGLRGWFEGHVQQEELDEQDAA